MNVYPKIKVRAGRYAGASHLSDVLSACNVLSFSHQYAIRTQMHITCFYTAAMVKINRIACGAVQIPRIGYCSAVCRVNRRSADITIDADINPLVIG